jgi:CBS domain-containing protein
LHWSLLVLASILTWSLAEAALPSDAGGYATAAYWVVAALVAIALLGWCLAGAARAERADAETRHILDHVTVGDVMTSHPAMVPDTMTLATLVGCVLQKIHGSTVPIVRDGRLVGLVTPDHLRHIAPGEWRLLTTADVATPVGAFATATAHEPLLAALDRLATDERRIVVVDDDDATHVVGVITPTDLARTVRLARLREAAVPV